MSLSADDLQQKARALTGIDLDDAEIQEALIRLVDSLNRESNLTPAGETAMEKRLIHTLANRLRMERDFINHPEIAEDQHVISPIFITGLPRSGTTKLQKLLSASGDFTELPYWMSYNPSLITGDRNEKPDPRIEDTEQHVQWMDRTSPNMKLVHPFFTNEPEEVNPILEQALLNGFYFSAFVDVPSYMGWYVQQDMGKQLQYLRRTLQYLQWQFDIDTKKPWVLKNPTFSGAEPLVLNAFPDAKFIIIHRHPSTCIASAISLLVAFHKLYSDVDIKSSTDDITSSAGFMLAQGLAATINQSTANRMVLTGGEMIDVSYSDLSKTSLAVVEEIYQRIGKPLYDSARSRINQWEQINRQHKHGVHSYSLAEFGLSDQMIDEAFCEYIGEYSRYF
jgi:LPS sulfotransferase NodH